MRLPIKAPLWSSILLAGLFFLGSPFAFAAPDSEYFPGITTDGDTTYPDITVPEFESYGYTTGGTSICSGSGTGSSANDIIPTSCANYSTFLTGGAVDMESISGGVDGTYWIVTYAQIFPTPYPRILWAKFTRSSGIWTGDSPPYADITTDITATSTWSKPTVYRIHGDIAIEAGTTLNIEPGTIIKFDTATSSGLTVEGALNAIGTANEDESLNQIFFTSLADDLAGGDSNENASSTVASIGDWSGVTIESGGSADLRYTTVRYAGSGGSSAEVHNNGGTLAIASSTITLGTDYGIRNSNGTTTVTSSDLSFSDYGLYLESGNATITASSTIHDNGTYGIYNDTGGTVDAEKNWWGSNSGPSDTYGSEVYGNVDYTPWITTIHFVSSELSPFCSFYHECNSVLGHSILLEGTTSYPGELSAATTTWNALGNVNIIDATSTATLRTSDIPNGDVAWKGQWLPNPSFPDDMKINTYYLNTNSSQERQNVFTHELGHALGLTHSYTGNTLYPYQTSQIILGPQDESDYFYVWP